MTFSLRIIIQLLDHRFTRCRNPILVSARGNLLSKLAKALSYRPCLLNILFFLIFYASGFLLREVDEAGDVDHRVAAAGHDLGQYSIPLGQEEILQILICQSASVCERFLSVSLALSFSNHGLGVDLCLGEFLLGSLHLLLRHLLGFDRVLVFS